jgi:hypothetical protein
MVSILPKLLDPAFAANVQFIIRQMVGGVDSTPILAIPLSSSPASSWPAEASRRKSQHVFLLPGDERAACR